MALSPNGGHANWAMCLVPAIINPHNVSNIHASNAKRGSWQHLRGTKES